MLLGHPNAKADIWLLRFVRQAVDQPELTPDWARQLVVGAADVYGVSA